MKDRASFLPDSFKRPGDLQQMDTGNVLLRTEVLSKINAHHIQPIVVSYPEAVYEKVPDLDSLFQHKIEIKIGELLDLDFIIEILLDYGFEREDFVYEPGQFSIRGSIIDIYSYGNEMPCIIS